MTKRSEPSNTTTIQTKRKTNNVFDNDHENKEISRRYRKLLRHAKPFLNTGDSKDIRKAFNLALEAHKGMRRRSGEPYIFHPIAVAQICVEEIGLGTTSIISALLHDVVEDTEIELDDIEKSFGPKVAQIIDGLTKIKGVFEHGTSQQAENFRKMLLTLSEDVRVILIKIADRVHNMRTLDDMPRHKQLKIASETMYLYAPLAHRLGLYALKSELEDLYLKYTEYETYRDIANKIRSTKSARAKFINQFIKPIEKGLKEHDLEFTIKGRPKSIHSIFKKLRKQNIEFEEIYDLFAIRIIIESPPEKEKAHCWQAYSIVTDYYKPNPDRLRDWVSTPKGNGYESLHTTVMSNSGQWVEVQIRTRRMDDIAEKGYAAHWKYKDMEASKSQRPGLDEWINKVRDMLEQPDSSALEFIDEFRTNLYNEDVFVFTPNGDLKILPNGATALDFAFDIHTDIGLQCLSAKVNQKLVPLSYILNNGDQIEILTSKKQSPSEDWLRFVVTSRARSKIKSYLKEEKKQKAEEGKVMLMRKFKNHNLEFSDELVNKMRAFFHLKTHLDLYYRFAQGVIDIKDIKHFLAVKDEREKSRKISGDDPEQTIKEIRKTQGERDLLLIGEELEKIDYTLAKCCNPINGDDVFGFITVNEGIKIHRTSCPNAMELMSNYGYRVIKAKWTSKQQIAFLAGLKIVGTDRVGIANDITAIISNNHKVNMRSITIDSNDGIFEGTIKVYVNDTRHLDQLTKSLDKVEGVNRITRLE